MWASEAVGPRSMAALSCAESMQRGCCLWVVCCVASLLCAPCLLHDGLRHTLQGDDYNLAIEYSCGWAVPGVWMKSVDLGFGRMRDLTKLTGRAQIMSLA